MKNLQNSKSKKAVLTGSMLVIDPSSGGSSKNGTRSCAGWATFEKGVLTGSGVLEFPADPVVHSRLKTLGYILDDAYDGELFDIFVLENVRGYKVQQSLIQSCGVYISRVPFTEFFQINVQTWKSIARQWGGYEKSDETDAVYMGYASVAIALGYHSKLKAPEREEIILKAQEVTGYA